VGNKPCSGFIFPFSKMFIILSELLDIPIQLIPLRMIFYLNRLRLVPLIHKDRKGLLPVILFATLCRRP
jgi:hypothetical protein